MDYQKYRDRRLHQNAELANAYAEEDLEREIGRQVLRLCQMRGWIQAQLPRHWKQNCRPSLATLNRIREVLDACLEVRLPPS